MSPPSPAPTPSTPTTAVDVAEAAEAAEAAAEEQDPFTKALDRYFCLLAALQYDGAKDAADKVPESKRGGRPQQLCSLLTQLAAAERQYFNLSFMLPKGFFQRDNSCKMAYENLRAEFDKLSAQAPSPTEASPSRLTLVAGQLSSFVSCRSKMIEAYERAANVGAAAVNPRAPVQQQQHSGAAALQVAAAMAKDFKHFDTVFVESLTEPSLEMLQQLLEWELECVYGYLNVSGKVDSIEYCDSWKGMSATADCRKEWVQFINENRYVPKLTSFMAGLGLGGKRQPQPPQAAAAAAAAAAPSSTEDGEEDCAGPPLFEWITKTLRDAVYAKLTFVFAHSLVEGRPGGQEEFDRVRKAKLGGADLHSKLVSFQRRTEAFCVAVVYDASESVESFRGWPPPPFSRQLFPAEEAKETFGELEVFPAVFHSPAEAGLDPTASEHWPAVVMLLERFHGELSSSGAPSAVVRAHDAVLDLTFFLSRVGPPNLTAVVAFHGDRRAEPQLDALFKEAAATFTLAPILAKLKP